MSMTYKSAVDLTQKLVSVDSVSAGGNNLVANLLHDYLRSLGFHVQAFQRDHLNVNLVARIGSGTGGLAFVGHLDTVPYQEERDRGLWNYEPLDGVISDGRIHGVGTADMKGPIAAAIFAGKRFVNERLTKPFAIVLTDTEEAGHKGAQHLRDKHYLSSDEFEYAVVGEPTSLAPVTTHLGIGETDIFVYGKGGHGSMPHLGVNAIEIKSEVVRALRIFKEDLRINTHTKYEDLYTSLNMGREGGGTAKNKIPDMAWVSVQYRPLPDVEKGHIHNQIKEIAERVAASYGGRAEAIPLREDPAFEISPDIEIARFFQERTKNKPKGVQFSTEAVEMLQMGIKPVVFGPGEIFGNAHQPNESLSLADLANVEEYYAEAIQRFCMR